MSACVESLKIACDGLMKSILFQTGLTEFSEMVLWHPVIDENLHVDVRI